MMFSNKMNCVGLLVFQFEVTRGTGESENEELNFKKKKIGEKTKTRAPKCIVVKQIRQKE